MPRPSHHTLPPLERQLQESIQAGWQDLVDRLPAELDQQAQTLGALVRHRAFKQASGLLRGLLAYVLCVGSFRQLGAWAVLIGLCNLSEAAWRKALRRARPWLFWLLSQLVLGPSISSPHLPNGTRVLLIDATRLREVGGSGDDWRVHLAYDLLAGRLAQVSVTDQHGAEELSHFDLRPGDITVHDMGYGYRKRFAFVLMRGGQVVGRIYPHAFPLLDEQDQPIAVVDWLKTLPQGTHSRRVRFVHKDKIFDVRLIVRSLSAEAAERARVAKRKKAAKDQRQLKDDTLVLAGWIVLISSLPPERWSDEQILTLYRARWQIELVFKRMKQLMRLGLVRCRSQASAQATILAWLIAWALAEQQMQPIRACLQELPCDLQEALAPEPACDLSKSSTPAALSSWQLAAVGVQTLRVLVQGCWTLARLEQCLPLLHRFLRGSPRKRRQQEQTIRTMLTLLMGSDLPLESFFFSCSSA